METKNSHKTSPEEALKFLLSIYSNFVYTNIISGLLANKKFNI
jgi:hypothetical protein